MPKFTYEDTQTGKTLTLDRETEPSESELTQLFSSQQPAAKPAEQSVAQSAAMPDSAMQFLGNPQGQAPVPVASLEVMSGGFPAAPKAALPPRPTQTDAIRKAVELSMGGAFGVPTVSQITQIYFNLQNEYDRAIKPVDKSERDKAFEILHNQYVFEKKTLPDATTLASLYKQAATIGTRQFSEGGFMMNSNGEFVGHSFLDSNSGDVMVRQPDGVLRKIRPGDIPTTSGSFAKTIMPLKDFQIVFKDVRNDEASLRSLSSYVKKVGDLPSGIARFANDLSARYNVLMSDPTTASQIKTEAARGEFEGLVGKMRTVVSGPGTQTEQDIKRIIARLGGKVDAFQDPKVVKEVIADVYGETYLRYQDNLNTYHYALDSYWGRKGSAGESFFKKITPMEFDNSLIGGAIGVFGVPKSLQEKKDNAAAIRAKLGK
jgi:hypothetical protein